jgi:hypothetical protein
MSQMLTNIVWGLVVAGLIVLWFRTRRGGAGRKGMEIRAASAIEELRAIGVLSAFQGGDEGDRDGARPFAGGSGPPVSGMADHVEEDGDDLRIRH